MPARLSLDDLRKRYPNQYNKDCYLTDELYDRRNHETPDFLDLKRQTNIPVFLYGPEKIGGKLNRFIQSDTKAVFLGEGRTATQSYVMERAEWDGPVVFNTVAQNSFRVYGEVYLVSPKTILNLDKLNANNEMTRREKKFVWLMEQGVKGKPKLHPALKCWMYCGREDYWEDQTTQRMGTIKGFNGETAYEWKTDDQFEIPDFLQRSAY